MVARVANKLSAVDDANPALRTAEVKTNPITRVVPAMKSNPTKIEAQVPPVPQGRHGLITRIGRFWRVLTGRA
jgi:hypothetical protein